MNAARIPEGDRLAVFSLESGAGLLGRICGHLGVEPGRHEERDFEDGEHKVRPLESVRGRDVYLVESLASSGSLSVNDKLVRVLFFLGALRDAGAARLTMVAPYLCYSRKDMRTKPRDPVSSRYIAALFESVGVDGIATMDVHNPAAFENAFRTRTEHLTAAPAFVDAFCRLVDEPPVVVSPDAGGVKRAERFRQALETRLEEPVGSAFIEKFRSEGVVRGGTVVGDVDGRAVIIVDDLISSGTTLDRAAKACRQNGAKLAYAAVTHGVFSAKSSQVLDESQLERVVMLDTIPPQGRIESSVLDQKFEVLDCAPLLAEAIGRLHADASLVELEGFSA